MIQNRLFVQLMHGKLYMMLLLSNDKSNVDFPIKRNAKLLFDFIHIGSLNCQIKRKGIYFLTVEIIHYNKGKIV